MVVLISFQFFLLQTNKRLKLFYKKRNKKFLLLLIIRYNIFCNINFATNVSTQTQHISLRTNLVVRQEFEAIKKLSETVNYKKKTPLAKTYIVSIEVVPAAYIAVTQGKWMSV